MWRRLNKKLDLVNWKTLSEEPPELSAYYLVTVDIFDSPQVEKAYYSHVGKWRFANLNTKKWEPDDIKAKHITHLMPIEFEYLLNLE